MTHGLNTGMHLYSSNLLLPYGHTDWRTSQPYTPKTMQFDSADSEHLFMANLRRQPHTWYYRDHSVDYTWNSNGYRASEWADVDWSNSWIVMGCSHVLGVGVAYEDTLGEQLSRYIGASCINLGMGGSGWPIIMYNTIRLLDQGVKPRGVVIVSPHLTRTTYWREQCYHTLNQYSPSGGCEDTFIQNAYQAWLRYEPNAEMNGYMLQRGVLGMWAAARVPVVPSYYFKEKDPTLSQGIHLPPRQDFARDIDIQDGNMIGHFGRATLGSWARAIAEAVQNT